MDLDFFDNWGVERALAIMDNWPGASIRPALRGSRKGQHLKYSASYALEGAEARDLTVSKRGSGRAVRIFVNATSVDGRPLLLSDFPRVVELDRRPAGSVGENGNPGIRTGVNRNPTLKPRDHEIYELAIRDEASFKALLRWYSGQSSETTTPANTSSGAAAPVDASSLPAAGTMSPSVGPSPSDGGPETTMRRSVSLDELLQRLEANARTGRIGELSVLADEHARLASAGCADPAAHVKHTALENAAAGYDIESRWGGETRFIEVKATVSESDDFFMSENERATLAALGSQAWLYRVRVFDDGRGEVVERIPDPIAMFADDAFEAVAWRVRAARRR